MLKTLVQQGRSERRDEAYSLLYVELPERCENEADWGNARHGKTIAQQSVGGRVRSGAPGWGG